MANPALPTGLSLETSTCRISGTPTVTQIATDYTITASNSTENTSTIISITINDNPPSALTYAGHPFTLNTNQNNNLSVKIIYFIDYNTLKNRSKYKEFVSMGS